MLLATRFIPRFGVKRGIYYSVFHSISAFCNAGFDLMGIEGEYSSLVAFEDDIVVNLVVMSLILIGYISGIIGKAVSLKETCLANVVFWLYVLNFFMVATDYILCLYYTVQRKKLGLD